METVASVIDAAFAAAHKLSESVLLYTRSSDSGQKPFLSTQLEDAAVSALAELASAAQDHHGGYFARLEAAAALHRARRSLGDLEGLLDGCAAKSTGHVPELVSLQADASDAAMLVMAAWIAVRGESREPAP